MITTVSVFIGLLQGVDFTIDVPFVFDELLSYIESMPILLIKQLQRILQRLIHINIFLIHLNINACKQTGPIIKRHVQRGSSV